MSSNIFRLGVVFYFFFLLLTPLGIFNDWVPAHFQKDFYSIGRIDLGDDTGYYAFLRSAFFDGDWDFVNEPGYIHATRFLPTGYVFNHWQIGQSLLFLPFFLIGHVLALILSYLGYPISVDGYSFPYFFATGIATQTYVFLGAAILYKLLTKYFTPSTALWVVFGIWAGSHLPYYTFIRQRMAHGTEFFLSTLFLFSWFQIRESQEKFHHALLGSLLGLLCLTRISNACYFFMYLTGQVLWWARTIREKNKEQRINIKKQTALFLLLSLLVFSPQIFTWFQFYGSPFVYFSEIIEIIQAGGFVNLGANQEPQIGKVAWFLFGGPWPLVYTLPIWALGLLGVMFFRPVSREVQISLTVGLFSFFSLVMLTGYSYSYGLRNLTPAAPLLAVGLAAVFEKFSFSRISRKCLITFVGICVFFQYWMISLYNTVMVYSNPQFTSNSWKILRVSVVEFLDSMEPGVFFTLLRSTNLIRLLLFGGPEVWNYKDWLFLVIFPGFSLFCFFFAGQIIIRGFRNVNGFLSIQPKNAVLITTGISLFLMIFVGKMTPTKPNKEIEGRNSFFKLMNEGDNWVAKHEYDKAIKNYELANLYVPESWTPLYKLALTYENEKKYKKANEYYQAAYKFGNIVPSRVFNRMGKNLILLKRLDEAESVLLEGYEKDPLNKHVSESLGELYFHRKNLQKSKWFFKRALEIDPDYGIVYFNLAMLLTFSKQFDEALENLTKAARLGITGRKIEKVAAFYGFSLEDLRKNPSSSNHQAEK